jgi:hypothetical protein
VRGNPLCSATSFLIPLVFVNARRFLARAMAKYCLNVD